MVGRGRCCDWSCPSAGALVEGVRHSGSLADGRRAACGMSVQGVSRPTPKRPGSAAPTDTRSKPQSHRQAPATPTWHRFVWLDFVRGRRTCDQRASVAGTTAVVPRPIRGKGMRHHPAVGHRRLPDPPAGLAAQGLAGHRQRHPAGGQRARAGLAGPFAPVAEVTTTAVAELRLRVGQELWASVKPPEVRV
jgi:hypothetical protein